MTARNVPPRTSKRAVELYFHRLVRTRDFPRVWATKPVVRQFVLPAVLDGLLEDTVFIAQAVAHGWDLHRRHRVEKASRQAPQTSITQTRVGFLLQQLEPIEVLLLDGFFRDRIEEKVGDVVGQRAADEKLHREVVDTLRVLTLVGRLGMTPIAATEYRARNGRKPQNARVGRRPSIR